jgi:hypothetical protein
MSVFRDIQHGVNDPVDGVDVKRQINDNQTPHDRAQPTDPTNPRTGRNPAD